MEQDEAGSFVVYESLARIFLVKLIRKYSTRLEDSADHTTGFSSRAYGRVLRYVERSYSQEIGVDDLAREAHLSPSHFSRLFKRSLGQSPHQFLMKYRIERAKEILVREPDRPLAQVAGMTGFSDQAHFSRTFKRFAGTTPASFRTAHT